MCSDPVDRVRSGLQELGRAVLRNLHRVCRVYAMAGVVVPVFGIATASSLGVPGESWLIVSMLLTAGATAVLVLPRQHTIPARPAQIADTKRLAMYTGVFNLPWATVTVLMIVRPGSTTSV
ncbi:hypothetical protein V1460_13995 [Streptomyces sp. SCSIO 30461]|uniref:hypothetical protein n=1 Tax=Streptomyces sp. SCSIO 30461 TaxID=3118085 RepID=UPI0030CE6F99